ncbi:MAG: polyketide synthase, partial [Jatrophihabitantaceae bacterium]
PDYVPVWSGLPDADLFDAEFFGYSPAEAELLDPQQRVFLETAWQAIEDAGLDPSRVGDVAVYAATGINQYLFEQLLPDTALVRATGSFGLAVSNDKDNLSTRVSYKLGLTGPSFTVQSNCSSGMVALHLAVSGLLDGQSDAALVGSVSIKGRTRRGYLAEAGGISSAGGVIRAFDADADGYFIGDAAAALVLKRYDDAVRDGDRVYAVVKGTAVNNDGSAKAGFSAPSKQGQVAVIRAALAMAEVKPETVGYIEANGSGTRLGDAIEVAALREAYAPSAVDADHQLIGSVKPNFGNLDASSGTASLLKAVLALHHCEIPPSINYAQPNPETDLAAGPIRVNDVLRDWPVGPDGVRRAGVSSFGVGGTNVHAILEEAPERPALPNDPGWHLILVSARTADALRASCRRLAAHLERHTEQSLADVAFTSQLGRKAFEHRTFVVAERRGTAVRALQTAATRAVHERAPQPPVVPLTALSDLDRTAPAYGEELTRLGQAWQAGASIAWSALHPAAGRHR